MIANSATSVGKSRPKIDSPALNKKCPSTVLKTLAHYKFDLTFYKTWQAGIFMLRVEEEVGWVGRSWGKSLKKNPKQPINFRVKIRKSLGPDALHIISRKKITLFACNRLKIMCEKARAVRFHDRKLTTKSVSLKRLGNSFLAVAPHVWGERAHAYRKADSVPQTLLARNCFLPNKSH